MIDIEPTGLGDGDVEVMDELDAVVAGTNIVVGASSESIQAFRESKRRGSRSIPFINAPRFLIISAYLLFGREVLWVSLEGWLSIAVAEYERRVPCGSWFSHGLIEST